MKKNIPQSLAVSLLTIFALFGFNAVASVWEPPTNNPPDGNADAPISKGGAGQTKTGGLSVGAGLASTDDGNLGFAVLGGQVWFPGASTGNPGGAYTHFNYNGANYIRGASVFDGRIYANQGIRSLGSSGSVFLNLESMESGASGLAVGYGGTYNGTAMTNAAFLQAESQGVGYRDLLLNPLGGAVKFGSSGTPANIEINGNFLIGPGGTAGALCFQQTSTQQFEDVGTGAGCRSTWPIVYVRSADLPNGSGSEVTVSCNLGGVATGGGYYAANTGGTVSGSQPSGLPPTGWTCTRGNGVTSGQVTCYAVCMK